MCKKIQRSISSIYKKKLLDSGHLSEKNLDIEILKELLHQKIDKTDFDLAKEDVRPFISSSTSQLSVDNWDKDLFHALVNRLESEV